MPAPTRRSAALRGIARRRAERPISGPVQRLRVPAIPATTGTAQSAPTQAPTATAGQLAALIVTAVGVSAAYVYGLRDIQSNGRLVMVWPVVGAAVGVALWGSRRLGRVLVALVAAVSAAVLLTGRWPVVVSLAVAALIAAALGGMVWSMRRLGMRRLRRPQDLGILLAVTAVVAVLTGVPAFAITALLPDQALAPWAIPLTWGVVGVAPVLLAARWPTQWPLRRAPEFLTATALTGAAGVYIFHVVTPGALGLFGWPYLVIVGQVWLAVRLGVAAVAPVACAVSWYGSVKTLAGEGPFTASASDPLDQLLVVQLFMLVITATVLLVGVLTDERSRTARELSSLALQDPVTGLPNRRALHEHLSTALARLHRRPGTLAILFCDLDEFKQVNDTLGHDVGDHLLAEVARRMRAGVRPDDTVARHGGDEFVVVCEGLRDDGDAADLALRLQDRLRPAWTHLGHTFHPTMSVGISSTSDPSSAPDELLRLADVAMYRAKGSGRNAVRTYEQSLDQGLQHTVAMHHELRRALDRGDLVLHYQPIVDMTGNTVIGSEALVRLRAEDGTIVMPGSFIPLAEHTGLISDIGAWVIRRAFLDLREQQRRLGRTQIVSINVSPQQLHRPGFSEELVALAREYGIDPALVAVEVTESALRHDDTVATDALTRLRAAGVTIALDDFGTGYSSLSRLSEFPVDLVKIDRSFTAHAGTNPRRTAVLASVLAVARELSLTVVAEGIETIEQRDLLVDLTCPLGQGFLWSRPVSIDEAPWLAEAPVLP